MSIDFKLLLHLNTCNSIYNTAHGSIIFKKELNLYDYTRR